LRVPFFVLHTEVDVTSLPSNNKVRRFLIRKTTFSQRRKGAKKS
jgi:hypothetical protein